MSGQNNEQHSAPPSYQEQLDYLNYCLNDYIDKANSKETPAEELSQYRGLIDMTQALIVSVNEAKTSASERDDGK